jgi:CysZ protein
MTSAAFKALGDLLSADFRRVLWASIGLTLGLFVALFAIVQTLFWFLTFVPWPWVETLLAVGAGLGMLVLFFFLMAPVTAMFAGLYLDRVAEKVERAHYPGQQQGTALPATKSIRLAVQFGLVVLGINILALPFIFTGVGAVVLVMINAYLLSREYFELAAMRVMPVAEARALRQENGASVFIAGLLPALLALVPVVNLAVPVFATSYFVHLFRQVRVSSA